MRNVNQEVELWKRLIESKPLDGLGLATKEGRVDLSRLRLPEPTVAKELSTSIAEVAVLSGQTKLKGVRWDRLDFTGSRLNGLLLFDCEITDCIFDDCKCQEWGLWATVVSSTSFRFADLRKAALGGIQEGRRNIFKEVDFTEADLHQIACSGAQFFGCVFKDTRLFKVDFGGSSFTDCRFEGELREVCFNRVPSVLPPNEMLRVDFSRAQLRSVEFRGLDLQDVRFQLVLRGYKMSEVDWVVRRLGVEIDELRARVAELEQRERERESSAEGAP